ncbi:MAG: hypothetical protein ABI644_09095 [Arenimonas sp.]
MTPKKFLYLLIGFLACFVAIGIPYWQLPYSAVSLPDSLYTIGLLLTFLGAIVFCIYNVGFLWSAAVFGCCAPAVVATRIIIDTARDGSTHNLFPFEIAIAVIIGFSIAGFGAMLGTLTRKIVKRISTN